MKTYLEPKEVEQIEQAADNLRDKLLVRLLSHLGCRVSEALGIAISDIDFNQGTVTIVHLMSLFANFSVACEFDILASMTRMPGLSIGKIVLPTFKRGTVSKRQMNHPRCR